jgi:hypothetical protein
LEPLNSFIHLRTVRSVTCNYKSLTHLPTGDTGQKHLYARTPSPELKTN